jgi:hypothetical protein
VRAAADGAYRRRTCAATADRAAARIGVGEPAADAVEHRARRSGEVREHRLGRVRRRCLGGGEPALHLLGGALGLALEARPSKIA